MFLDVHLAFLLLAQLEPDPRRLAFLRSSNAALAVAAAFNRFAVVAGFAFHRFFPFFFGTGFSGHRRPGFGRSRTNSRSARWISFVLAPNVCAGSSPSA